MKRTAQQRMDAIAIAIGQREEFMAAVKDAEGDAVRCADLMARAVTMRYEANGLEPIGRDGRSFAGVEDMVADHCLIAARDAYLRARGSNTAPPTS